MGYDGTVKIGTELDSSGVKKGLDEINGTAQSGFSKFSEIGKNAKYADRRCITGQECRRGCP